MVANNCFCRYRGFSVSSLNVWAHPALGRVGLSAISFLHTKKDAASIPCATYTNCIYKVTQSYFINLKWLMPI